MTMNIVNLNFNHFNLDKVIVENINIILSRYFNDLEEFINQDVIDGWSCGEYLLAIGECIDILDDKEKWLEISYKIMVKIRGFLEQNLEFLSLGFFSGLCHLGFSVLVFYKNTGHYKKFLSGLNNLIFDKVPGYCDSVIKNKENLKAQQFDLISGLSGIGYYLLECPNCEKREIALRNVLDCLVSLILDNYVVEGVYVPHWYISRDNQNSDEEKKIYSKGNFNFGLSHGIVSVLVTLSKAYKNRMIVDRHRKAIDEILKLYTKYGTKSNNENLYLWPGFLSFEDYVNNNINSYKSKRQSWCYGSVGISGAILNASILIQDDNMADIMYNNLCKIAEIENNSYELLSPIICHGFAGVLIILLTAYKIKPNEKLYKKIIELTTVIINMYEPQSVFGFKDVSLKYENKNATYQTRDNNSFLEGTTGIILVLIALFKKETLFERHLLLN